MTDLGLIEFFAAEDEVAAEVFFTHHGIVRQFFAGALEKDFALEKQVGTVGDTECLGRIVVGNQNADILFLQLIHDALNVFHSDRVDAGKRLIEHDKLWLNGKASRYLGASSLAS